MSQQIIIGSRGSKLALWQAYFTKDKLEQAGYQVELKIIKTKGDKIQHLSFDKIEGKGFFTKEIEDALLANEIDLAVHSCKDMPTVSPEGLEIAAFSSRAAAHDVLLIHPDALDKTQPFLMKPNAVVGTSSARRKAQLLCHRPDIEIKDIRGNVPTRIDKLREKQFDAILLAAAGLNRLEIELDENDVYRFDLDPLQYIPAPAQGVLAYQIRANDERLREVVEVLDDKDAKVIAATERSILNAFQGGCQMPLGVYAKSTSEGIRCWASKSTAWNVAPKRLNILVDENFDAQQIVEQLSKSSSKKVFVSKPVSEKEFLKRTLGESEINIEGQRFIQFKPVAFDADFVGVDCVFFASKNGVKYFFEQVEKLPSNIKIAAINKGTASSLNALGLEVDFVGEGNDLQQIAQHFDGLGIGKTLFVRASVSKRSIQQTLAKTQHEDVVVYANSKLEEFEQRQEDILVFTSPMNVEAYFDKYKLQAHQQLIAIGPSTAKALASYGLTCRTAFEPTMWSIADEIFAAL